MTNQDREVWGLCSVGARLFGVYSPEDSLLSVHLSAEGAHKNKEAFEDNYKVYGYYVDYVILNP